VNLIDTPAINAEKRACIGSPKMEINFNGMKLTVFGKYYKAIQGNGWGAWRGPTPDEPEDFEIEDILFAGTSVYELLECLYRRSGENCIDWITKECIRKANEGPDND
jgi:hypothetical protein